MAQRVRWPPFFFTVGGHPLWIHRDGKEGRKASFGNLKKFLKKKLIFYHLLPRTGKKMRVILASSPSLTTVRSKCRAI